MFNAKYFEWKQNIIKKLLIRGGQYLFLMFQYHLDLSFVNLTFKTTPIHQTTLRITLLQSSSQLDPTSLNFQTEELIVKKFQKSVSLIGLPLFKFTVISDQIQSYRFQIKYSLKSKSDERVWGIPLNIKKMIMQYEKNKVSQVSQNFSGQKAQIVFKISITKTQFDKYDLLKSSNELNKKISIEQNQKEQANKAFQVGKIKQLINTENETAFSLNKILDSSTPQLYSKEFPQKQSSINSSPKKMDSNIGESDLKKVDYLISTHQKQQQFSSSSISSYKIKIVIGLFLIGLIFLFYDALGDEKVIKKKVGKKQNPIKSSKKSREQTRKSKKQ